MLSLLTGMLRGSYIYTFILFTTVTGQPGVMTAWSGRDRSYLCVVYKYSFLLCFFFLSQFSFAPENYYEEKIAIRRKSI